jgi:hypothetical protein
MTQFRNLSVFVNGSFEGKGLYFEWLQTYVNLIGIICSYTSLFVYEEKDFTEFVLRADDCTQATFVFKRGILWLTSPFIEDEREFIIEPKEYNQMLKQFASEHGIKNVLYKPE